MIQRFRQLVVLLGLLAPGATAGGQAALCERAPPGVLAPSRDLYCLALVAAPDIDGISGHVELGQPAGPFTIAVTADGRIRYAPTIVLSGLPAPSSLGRFQTYVAWLATPVMYPIVRLGVVGNGRTRLPTIDLDKLMLLIPAAASTNGTEPAARVVVLAASPSTRLQPPVPTLLADGARG